MKTIVFKYNKGWNNVVEEEMEFDESATEKEINEAFQEWVWEQVMDNFTWYEKR